jgi:hypothetical protein
MGRNLFNKRLIHTCDISAPQTTRDGGEVQVTYGTETTIDCRYYAFNERWAAESQSRQVFRQHRILAKAGSTVDRRYRVRNILDKDGNVVDAGPFIVTEKLVMSDGRGTHHIELEMERSD